MIKFKKILLKSAIISIFAGIFINVSAFSSNNNNVRNLKKRTQDKICNEERKDGFYFIVSMQNNTDKRLPVSLVDIIIKYLKCELNKYYKKEGINLNILFQNYEIDYDKNLIHVKFYVYPKDNEKMYELTNFIKFKLSNLNVQNIIEIKEDEYKKFVRNYILTLKDRLYQMFQAISELYNEFKSGCKNHKDLKKRKKNISNCKKCKELEEYRHQLSELFQNFKNDTVHTGKILSVLNQDKKINELLGEIIKIVNMKEDFDSEKDNFKNYEDYEDYDDIDLYSNKNNNYDDSFHFNNFYKLDRPKIFSNKWNEGNYFDRLNNHIGDLQGIFLLNIKNLEKIDYKTFKDMIESVQFNNNNIKHITRVTKTTKSKTEVIKERN